MKTTAMNLVGTLCAAATLAMAEDKPGKSSDAVNEPTAPAVSKSTAPADRKGNEPGKSSDSVREETAIASKPFHGRISSVDERAKTVILEDKSSGTQTLHVGTSTKLTKSGNDARWSDLKVGETVKGSFRKSGEQLHAESMLIGE